MHLSITVSITVTVTVIVTVSVTVTKMHSQKFESRKSLEDRVRQRSDLVLMQGSV
jgi:hypothetical protein